jgi:MoCo/4Fe-4S cofactor protein with predicted Tat translocation signal
MNTHEEALAPPLRPAAPEVIPLPVVSEQRPQWRSLEEKRGDPALAQARAHEFPEGASAPPDGVMRRTFLQLVSGSLALAGAAACWRPPQEQIFTFTKAPANVLPGVPYNYATATVHNGYATGVVVESFDGRPVKVEGNPLHPASQGAAGAFEQASLMRLYDPQRATTLTRRGRPQGFRQFLADIEQLRRRLGEDGGSKLRFLVEPTTSPVLAFYRAKLLEQFPRARFYSWAPVSNDNVRRGSLAAFGAPLDTHYRLSGAKVIVSLDADFLSWDPEHLRLNREFAHHRVPQNGMNRLYVAETSMSVTGSMADHRLRARSSEILGLARALAAQLATRSPGLGQFGGAELPAAQHKWVQAVAKDLGANAGQCVVIAGQRQPAAVHALAHALNAELGNLGKTVTFTRPVALDPDSGTLGLRQLVREIEEGDVETLVITAYNPVYTAPADVDLAAALGKVPRTLYHHYYRDETAEVCSWLIPQTHELETWGDARAPDGTTSIIQPLLSPLFAGVAPVSLYAALVGEGHLTPYELVRAFWQQRSAGGDFEAQWQRWLADGVIPDSAEPEAQPEVSASGVSAALQEVPVAKGELEVGFVPDYRTFDGRFANNAWLQELPDPITKITWDNAAYLSPKTAERLGVKLGDVVSIRLRERTLEAPVYVLPGHADEAVTLPLGYGRGGPAERTAAKVGFDAGRLRFSDAPWFDGGATVEKTRRRHKFAITQDHWSMEGRPMALQGQVQRLEQLTSELEHHRGPHGDPARGLPTLQPPVQYTEGYQWAMAIDLSRCTGCSACVIACQAENNIPVVGKDQIHRSREMHWLMIDRYFVGESADEVEVVTQPRMCVHCETAPCEYVCPVNATVHNEEGLNEMVYNRCIGTRYCSNNCPYRVRRFNYLQFNGDKSPTEKMAMNPDVTVRARGVMEKCTYCVQRIERARITTRIAGTIIRDGELQTACQQSCPAEAIVFGSLTEEGSRVSKLHQDSRRYDLLHLLNTRPRTGYLARIKNPNPELA